MGNNKKTVKSYMAMPQKPQPTKQAMQPPPIASLLDNMIDGRELKA